MFPLISFDIIDHRTADAMLAEWGHFLGGCKRPFGRQSFGLHLEGELIAVAVSASTVNKKVAGQRRDECCELVRLCAKPGHQDITRPTLRLWRKVAPIAWGRQYWPVRYLVSYANSLRHDGEVYKFDGWSKVRRVRGGKSGPNAKWTRKKAYDPKTVWMYPLDAAGRTTVAALVAQMKEVERKEAERLARKRRVTSSVTVGR